MLKRIITIYAPLFPVFIFSAFVGSLGLILFKKTSSKLILFAFGILIWLPVPRFKINLILIGTFVPTLVHVYVFTGLFMLYGAMKSGSITGYISIFIFIGGALSFYCIQYVPKDFSLSEYVKNSILQTGFASVNATAISLFKSGSTGIITQEDILNSRRGLMVQRFIAFAYTYHYLNWFSKTEIIKWHLVPKKWLIGSVLL